MPSNKKRHRNRSITNEKQPKKGNNNQKATPKKVETPGKINIDLVEQIPDIKETVEVKLREKKPTIEETPEKIHTPLRKTVSSAIISTPVECEIAEVTLRPNSAKIREKPMRRSLSLGVVPTETPEAPPLPPVSVTSSMIPQQYSGLSLKSEILLKSSRRMSRVFKQTEELVKSQAAPSSAMSRTRRNTLSIESKYAQPQAGFDDKNKQSDITKSRQSNCEILTEPIRKNFKDPEKSKVAIPNFSFRSALRGLSTRERPASLLREFKIPDPPAPKETYIQKRLSAVQTKLENLKFSSNKIDSSSRRNSCAIDPHQFIRTTPVHVDYTSSRQSRLNSPQVDTSKVVFREKKTKPVSAVTQTVQPHIKSEASFNLRSSKLSNAVPDDQKNYLRNVVGLGRRQSVYIQRYVEAASQTANDQTPFKREARK